MDIGTPDQQPPSIQGFTPQGSAPTAPNLFTKRKLPLSDSLLSKAGDHLEKNISSELPLSIDSPQLLQPKTKTPAISFDDQIMQLVQELQLPSAKDLANISMLEKILTMLFSGGDETNQAKKHEIKEPKPSIESQSDDTSVFEAGSEAENYLDVNLGIKEKMTSFFGFLSKAYPIGLSVHDSLLETSFGEKSPKLSGASEEVIDQLTALIEQQTFSTNPEKNTAITQALSQLNGASSEKQQEILRILDSESFHPGILTNTSDISNVLSSLSSESARPALSLLAFFQPFSFKPHIDEAAPFIEKNIKAAFDSKEDGTKSFLHKEAFRYASFTGALLGFALAFTEKREDNFKSAQLFSAKFEAIHQLKLLDLIPFSFLAFFPDIRPKKEENSKAVKAAKEALLQLIRILLQLIFVLSALAVVKEKLGKQEMMQVLERHSLFLLSLFDRLIFALKKVDELYVIDVGFQLKTAELTKSSLISKDDDQFWQSAIRLFSTKTELSSFLEGIEEAKTLFEAIKTILSGPEKSLLYNSPISQ